MNTNKGVFSGSLLHKEGGIRTVMLEVEASVGQFALMKWSRTVDLRNLRLTT